MARYNQFYFRKRLMIVEQIFVYPAFCILLDACCVAHLCPANSIQQILKTLESGHIFSELALAKMVGKNES